MQYRFSIVVPAYNEAAYLGRTLEALGAQDFAGGYEVIVVDNNSEDATADVARAHGVRVVHEPVPGVCAARQRGLEAARGEIVVSTDADTQPPPGWLSRIDAAFAEPGTIAVAGPCRYEDAHGWMRRYPVILFGLVHQTWRRTGWVGYVTATNLAIVRDLFPPYDPTLTQGGDELDVLRRVRRLGRVRWVHDNVVTTSPRRMRRGFAYNFVFTFCIYYLLAYAVNRLPGRHRLGTAPVVREKDPSASGLTGEPRRADNGPAVRRRSVRLPLRPVVVRARRSSLDSAVAARRRR